MKPIFDGAHRVVRWRDREEFSPGVTRCKRCGGCARRETIDERSIFAGYLGQDAVTIVVTAGCGYCRNHRSPDEPAVNEPAFYLLTDC